MSEARSVSSEVEVAVDAPTAFGAFTSEMNLWWVRGPINFFDAARAVALTCEPGVGGRFEPTAGGTIVRVLASIPAGGEDRGGTSWVRVVPPWFGAWCARRETASREPRDLGRLAVAVYYDKPAAAARWLAATFGFETPGRLPGDDADRDWDAEQTWIEFRVGDCSLMVFKLEGERPEGGADTHEPWVFVDDLDAHFARAQAAAPPSSRASISTGTARTSPVTWRGIAGR